MTKHYTNSEMTIVWKPEQCTHSTQCWRGLKEVFDPRVRPWIRMEGSTTERIIEQVKKCPSGALSYFMNAEGETGTEGKATEDVSAITNQSASDTLNTEGTAATQQTAVKATSQSTEGGTISQQTSTGTQQDAASPIQQATSPDFIVEVTPKGPYILNTQCVIIHPDGRKEVKEGVVALCRCGASNNKPYCDGRHHEIAFQG